MSLTEGKIRTVYFKYLGAAFGSALISSIYGLVDTAVVGQFQGPDGTAALAIVSPIWNIIYSLGLLTGIGGSILLSNARGKGNKSVQNQYFTISLIISVILSLIAWIGIGFFDGPLLKMFGADETLLPLAKEYMLPVKFGIPLFLMNQMLASFLRNDNNPKLATTAVLVGGIFNIVGDYLFVFTFKMGIKGAGLATLIGGILTTLVMMYHFISKRNTLGLVKPINLFKKSKKILYTGFSPFFIDASLGILTMFFNRQIVTYLDNNALAVYGVLIYIVTIVQCCAYSVGQAAQPIISENYGAKKPERIIQTLKYSLLAAMIFGIFWTILTMAFPNVFIRIFMNPSAEVLEIAPKIMRVYGISFILLPLNIFSTYYFQSLMKSGITFLVSVLRGIVISGLFIFLLPLFLSPSSLWLAMPFTELLTSIFVIVFIAVYTQKLKIELVL